MARVPTSVAADPAELSLVAGDSFDEDERDPVSASAGECRSLPPRRSRSAARTAIALEVGGETLLRRGGAGSARRGRGRLQGGRGRSRSALQAADGLSGLFSGAAARTVRESAAGGLLVGLPQAGVANVGEGSGSGSRDNVAPALEGGGVLEGGPSGAGALPPTSGLGHGMPGSTASWWSSWPPGPWGSPWGPNPWAMVPPPYHGAVPPPPWSLGFPAGSTPPGGDGLRDQRVGVWPSGLTSSSAVQVAGPCLDFFPQASAADRECVAGTSASGVPAEESDAARRLGIVEPDRATRRSPAMVVAAEGATPGAAGGEGRPTGEQNTGAARRVLSVWIVGHSFVHWAGERAVIRPGGQHLGLHHRGVYVSWWGQRGMRWHQLLPLLEDLRHRARCPDLLLFHLGGNDVDAISGKHLIDMVIGDLGVVQGWFPSARLVWSDIIPRPKRLVSRRWTRGLTKVNRQIGRWVEARGGVQIRHSWVDVSCSGLFFRDQVHLSDIGWDLLLDDFATCCERVLDS
uniref:Collagen alpha-2(I) chain-like n=1 Tax=Geotrypetes seraphini TaxID=260995 RepID=A0A6P8NRM8_GEOSA|nr:collagen alpha-2(I) chain-like [Geotrypetes seraphini]